MAHDTTTPRTGTASFKSVAQMYDSDDPSPEAHRDLSENAEDRIFHAILSVHRGLRTGICDRLAIRVPDTAPGQGDTIVSAVREHFLRRADEKNSATKVMVRVGLRECWLTAAVCIPAFIGIGICSQFRGNPFVEVAENVLIIMCWVVIWQPFQSLVFDRWTLKETAAVYRKIAQMPISVITAE
ncbi:hypothetical protein [Methanoregula sp.]|uniref:hypothetical protein n=1 Tax=Methanoregula sp. TaxID=2052170 RepID=UPI002C38A9B4|nr:hypothetical protein [Methanoregula sp.]HVP96503.1 hypothetical protein [Methanoregula sp.]